MLFLAVDVDLLEQREHWLKVVARPDVTDAVQYLEVSAPRFLLRSNQNNVLLNYTAPFPIIW